MQLANGKFDEFVAKINIEKLRSEEETKARFEAFIKRPYTKPPKKWWEFWK